MTDEATLKNLRARISAATQEEARASVARDNALKNREKALSDLEAKFGVTSVEEADKLLKELKKELKKTVDKIEDSLDKLDA